MGWSLLDVTEPLAFERVGVGIRQEKGNPIPILIFLNFIKNRFGIKNGFWKVFIKVYKFVGTNVRKMLVNT